MPCYKPNQVWQPKEGGQVLWTEPPFYYYYKQITIPCGQCIGCRLERSRQWAMRCVHESKLYTYNSFITLTYNNESLPANGSLDKTHYQKFMKRFRKQHPKKTIRFYMCGEYGDQTLRPHYHAIIFNHHFDDRKHHNTIKGNKLYKSDILQETWGKGHCLIGDVTFESAAY